MLDDEHFDIDLVEDHALTEVECGHLAHATLIVSIKSGLFELFINQPRSISEIADILKWKKRVVETIVASVAAMGLLYVDEKGKFLLTKVAKTYLISNSPYFRRDLIFSPLHEKGYVEKLWSVVTANRTKNMKYRPQPVNKEKIIDAQHYEALPRAAIVAKHSVFNGMKKYLDLGGAEGTYAIEIVRERPALNCIVMDCEHCCRLGERRTKENGLAKQITFVPKDMLVLPQNLWA